MDLARGGLWWTRGRANLKQGGDTLTNQLTFGVPHGEYHRHHSGLYLPGARRPTCIDLFAGCGGFSLGMIMGGFEVVAALEYEEMAAITYMCNLGTYPINIHYATPDDKDRLNKRVEKLIEKKGAGVYEIPVSGSGWISHNPGTPGVNHFFFGDIRKFTGKQILDAIGMKVGEVDCIVGGPPCQGFSYAGRRNVMDERNSLVFEFARMIIEIQPKTMIMENVPGIATMTTKEGLPVVDTFCRILEDGGFGAYDALKQSILATSGAGAAIKGQSRAKKNRKTKQPKIKKSQEGQLTLDFGVI